jgi:hypothetical protein
MESSLREQVRQHITEYSDNVKKYFVSLSTVAENGTLDKTNSPEYIIKQMASIDEKLQKAVEHSKLTMHVGYLQVLIYNKQSRAIKYDNNVSLRCKMRYSSKT